jgi:hypothetical protein
MFTINKPKHITSPPAIINIQSLANIQVNNKIVIGSIFTPIYATGPCSSCGK